jgi:isopenicillin-N N-acyltransferase-like protein
MICHEEVTMSRSYRWTLAVALCLLFPLSLWAEPFRYPEAKHGKGELKYIDGVPVLLVEGKPGEIGEQMAILTAKPAAKLLNYPRDFLKLIKLDAAWPIIVAMGKGLLPHFPPSYLEELESGVKASQLDRDLFVAGNTMFDIKKVLGCSALIVEPGKSGTKGMLFGRNLDFPTLGYLNDYSLVIVCKPEGKHAFASVSFPGLLGVLSGMNDAGLTLAVLESYSANDNSLKFDAEGTPYALCFRRMLEECTTVDEAEKLLRSMKRTTRISLAICDTKTSAVFEMTPKTVAVRPAENGICACTNHFRTRELAVSTKCWRYPLLEKCREMDKLGVADVARKLHEVNQGELTLQSMVFEPATLKLHVAFGKVPTSALPMKTLDLAPLLTPKKD